MRNDVFWRDETTRGETTWIHIFGDGLGGRGGGGWGGRPFSEARHSYILNCIRSIWFGGGLFGRSEAKYSIY